MQEDHSVLQEQAFERNISQQLSRVASLYLGLMRDHKN